MKKLFILLLICFIVLPNLFANDTAAEAAGTEEAEHDPFEGKKPFGIRDRAFEVGLNFEVFFANNFLTVGDIFKDTIVLDLSKSHDGFLANLGFGVTPFFFNFDSRKGWGFGLSTGLEGTGVLSLSNNLWYLKPANRDNSYVNGALFATVQAKSFFHIQKFKVTVNPGLFYPIVYFNTDVRYTFNNKYGEDGGTMFFVDTDMRIFSAFPMNDEFHKPGLSASPGFDITLGVQYPLAREIGLTEKIPFLDFDVSVNLVNLPIVSSSLKNYSRFQSTIGSDENRFWIIGDENDGIDFDSTSEETHGTGNKSFSRPLKLLISADWRPLLGSRFLTITPVLGLAHDDLHDQPISAEVGVRGTLNLANLFISSLGINYTDRKWVNSLDLTLNLRAFQLDLGVDMRSQALLKSWTAGGFAFRTGIRFGW